MLICVSVYHACQRIPPLGWDVTATECLFKKDKINWVNVNWPFSLVYHAQLCVRQKCQQICERFCMLCLCLWTTVTHLNPIWPISSSLRLNSEAARCPVTMQLLPSKALYVCLAYVTISDREVMWAVAFIWMFSPRKHSLSAIGCQSVSPSICHSKREQKEFK